jgi:sec-independent protein translocase protein TatC
MPRPTDEDLFAEEQAMPAMSFGEHIEDLRKHLIYALLGLMFGVVFTFLPPLHLGAWVLRRIQDPAQKSLDKFYTEQAAERAKKAESKDELATPTTFRVELADLAGALRTLAPDLKLPAEKDLEGKFVKVRMTESLAPQILNIAGGVQKPNALVSLAPLETFTIFFMVCLVTGLVITSPWVIWQLWMFIAAGLYRHERDYVRKFVAPAVVLFLCGVFLCFIWVLPITLQFLLQFNVWLGIEPSLRISEWVGFATIMPLIFGVCFQTPLVMVVLERLHIFTYEDFVSKWRFAVMIMFVAAAIITPTQDPFSMMLLAAPMMLLYGLGLFLIKRNHRADVPARVSA